MFKSAQPWGVTEEEAELEPWGITDRSLLLPGKRITDVIHGTVHLNKLEVHLLDSPAMQRLRRVRQLGTTQLVYPSATHNRLSHSLGALHVAQQFMNALFSHRHDSYRVARSLDHEWEAVERHGDEEARTALRRNRAEAVILARLGGLLHDMTHLPFGHTIEDDLKLALSHDENLARFEFLWGQLDIHEKVPPKLKAALLPLIVSKAGEPERNIREAKFPFVHDVVGNTICADLLDYIWRDHLHTGLPFNLGDRFLSSLFITSSQAEGERYYPSRVAVCLSRNGLRRADVETELLKCLRFRYELDERVLTHHAKLAADVMLGKLLGIHAQHLRAEPPVAASPDDEQFVEDYCVAAREKHEKEARNTKTKTSPEIAAIHLSQDSPLQSKAQSGVFDEAAAVASAHIQLLLMRHGDDGFLEHLRDHGAPSTAELAEMLLNRVLFDRLCVASDDPRKKEIYGAFGAPEERAALEKDAATAAGLGAEGVAVWIPDPKMRLKPAGVLVTEDDGARITKLDTALNSRAANDARVIYDQHKALWRVAVYVHPDTRVAQREELKRFIAQKLGVDWDNPIPHVARNDAKSRNSGNKGLQVAAESGVLDASEAERALEIAQNSRDELDVDAAPPHGPDHNE